MGFLLLMTLAASVPTRLVSEPEAQTVAAVFARALWGEIRTSGCRLYEDVRGRPVVYMCEGLLEDDAGVVIAVGARTDMPPVLFYNPPRAPQAVETNPTLEAAVRALGQRDVREVASVYYSPFDLWSEYEAGGRQVMVSLRNLAVCDPARVRDVEPPACDSGRRLEFAQQWSAYLSGLSPLVQDGQHWIEGVPDWDWHYGCAPTAAANVLTYWDRRGFGLLVDSVLRNVPDRLEKGLDSVPNVSRQLAVAMSTDTLHSGGTATDSIPIGITAVCSDPAWGNGYDFRSYLTWRGKDLVVSEIDSGRPGVLVVVGHPEYGNHAVTYCGWGPPSNEWIVVHDEWAGTPRDRVIYYDYGGPVAVVPVIPSEPPPEQPQPEDPDSVRTFPSPARDVLSVAGWQGPGLATAFDVAGRRVMRCLLPGSGRLDVSCLPSGVYALRLAWQGSDPAVARFAVTRRTRGP